ncbi:hypothetical protein [Pseudomonas schmalbachii]|uniref:Fap n=1 Tax=Pseudomonas schmalbachii TaxID=2816993 RepID=A0ABS3TP96_9PSED|nr:hypothetical protein [Pseudomonas schmalbachii]MBO3275478.1 hypothetical protein [Pseudomonas schmalbachii]
MEIIDSRTVVLCIALAGVASAPLYSTAEAAGDGTIVLHRQVQPRVATSPVMVPDPNPTTVNPNRSEMVIRMTNSTELTDNDFAGITSGAGIERHVLPGGNIPGLNNNTNNQNLQQTIVGGGSSGRAGSGIANTVNNSIQRGLAPLGILTGGDR